TFAQLPPNCGEPTTGLDPPHQLSKPAGTGRDKSVVGPSRSDVQRTLLKSVVAKLMSRIGSAFSRVLTLGSPRTSASESAFSGCPSNAVPRSTSCQVALSVWH